MNVVIYATAPHQVDMARKLAQGMRRHGEQVSIVDQMPRDSVDLFVCWGHRHDDQFAKQKASGRRYLIMERGYVSDRFYWTSLAFDGLNGRGDFALTGYEDGERWNTHFGHLMRPWQDFMGEGRRPLIIGQVEGDASLQGRSLEGWYPQVARDFNLPGCPKPIFRPHPVSVERGRGFYCPEGCELEERGQLLSTSLARAFNCVTWNSNTGVDAVLAGIPTIACDPGSMAWPVTSHSTMGPMFVGDRSAWANRLAWCQWEPHELADGTAWGKLKHRARLS